MLWWAFTCNIILRNYNRLNKMNHQNNSSPPSGICQKKKMLSRWRQFYFLGCELWSELICFVLIFSFLPFSWQKNGTPGLPEFAGDAARRHLAVAFLGPEEPGLRPLEIWWGRRENWRFGKPGAVHAGGHRRSRTGWEKNCSLVVVDNRKNCYVFFFCFPFDWIPVIFSTMVLQIPGAIQCR